MRIAELQPGSVSPSKSDENPWLVDAVDDGQTSCHPGWSWEDEGKPGTLERGSRDRPPHMDNRGWVDDNPASTKSSGCGLGRVRRQVKHVSQFSRIRVIASRKRRGDGCLIARISTDWQSWGRKWGAGSEPSTRGIAVSTVSRTLDQEARGDVCGSYGPHLHLAPTLQNVSHSLPEDLSTPKYFLISSFRDCHTEFPFDWRDAACKPTTNLVPFAASGRKDCLCVSSFIREVFRKVGKRHAKSARTSCSPGLNCAT